MRRNSLILLVLLSTALLLSSCDYENMREAKPSPDWSRGVLLGRGASGTLGIAADGRGHVHVAWPSKSSGAYGVQYVQLDQRSERTTEWLQPMNGGVRTTRLLPTGSGRLHLLFANRAAGDEAWKLRYISLDGRDRKAPDLSKSTVIAEAIGKYSAIADGAGGMFIVGDRGDPGEIWILHLDANGFVTREASYSQVHGEAPVVTMPSDGMLHLAWLAGTDLVYAQVDPDSLILTKQSVLSDLGASQYGYRVDGPTIGSVDEKIVVLWAVTPYTDTETGQAKTFYVSFQADEPHQQKPTRVWMLSSEDQPYTPYEGPLPLDQWVVGRSFSTAVEEFGQEVAVESEDHPNFVDIIGAASLFVMNPSAMSGTGDELAVAMVTKQDFRTDYQMQIAVALFNNSGLRGYALATRTERLSDQPALAMADNGHLHLAWREGSSGSEVYYATTSSEARDRLDRLTGNDAIQALPRSITDMTVGLLLTPLIGIWWILPGLLLLGLWRLFRPEQSGENLQLRLIFIVGLLAYYALKMVMLPTLFHYVPFSAWIFIPESWVQALKYGVPPLILLLALTVTILLHRRRRLSPPAFYLSIGLVDATLSLMIYGISFLGVF